MIVTYLNSINSPLPASFCFCAFKIMEITSKEVHPNKKAATPEDMAKAIMFLASEEASMITGAFLPVDGGWSLAGPQNEKVEEMAKRLPKPTS